jgi:hypothetical protein
VSSDFEPVRRLDAPAVVAALQRAGGPRVELVGPLTGGAVGAWLVRRPDGGEAVLTWAPSLPDDEQSSTLSVAIAMMELAATNGMPVPRYLAVVTLDDGGVAVLQQRAPGRPPTEATVSLIDQLLEYCDRRPRMC